MFFNGHRLRAAAGLAHLGILTFAVCLLTNSACTDDAAVGVGQHSYDTEWEVHTVTDLNDASEAIQGTTTALPAQPGWNQLGSTIGIDRARGPSPAFYAGTAYVAYQQYHGSSWDVHVSRFEGAEWVAMGNRLDRDGSQNAEDPSLAVSVDGRMAVAWAERFVSNSSVYAAEWNGSAWNPLGGALDRTDQNEARMPSIIATSQGWVVTFTERGDRYNDIRVVRWTGSSWENLGEAVDVNLEQPASASDAAVGDDGTIYISWSEQDGNSSNVHVARWEDGSWVHMGEALDRNLSVNASKSRITVAAAPAVLWREKTLTSGYFYCSRWTGTDWESVGNRVANGVTQNGFAGEARWLSDGSLLAFTTTGDEAVLTARHFTDGSWQISEASGSFLSPSFNLAITPTDNGTLVAYDHATGSSPPSTLVRVQHWVQPGPASVVNR